MGLVGVRISHWGDQFSKDFGAGVNDVPALTQFGPAS